MTEKIRKEQRSYIMSKIRSRWTGIEKSFHNHLKSRKIRHKMHPNIEGGPDIILTDYKIAVFLDGCFWHTCPKCKGNKRPSSNKNYWIPKINKTIKRDNENATKLRKNGCKVLRFWEHEINENVESCIEKLERSVKKLKKIKCNHFLSIT